MAKMAGKNVRKHTPATIGNINRYGALCLEGIIFKIQKRAATLPASIKYQPVEAHLKKSRKNLVLNAPFHSCFIKKTDKTRIKVHKRLDRSQYGFFFIRKNTDKALLMAIMIASDTDSKYLKSVMNMSFFPDTTGKSIPIRVKRMDINKTVSYFLVLYLINYSSKKEGKL